MRTAALKRNRFVMKKVTTATRDLVAKIMFKVSNVSNFNQKRPINPNDKTKPKIKKMSEAQSIHFNKTYTRKYQV